MDRVGEHFGEVTLFVSVFIHAVAEKFVANEAHMLAFHAGMLTRHIHITFVAPKVAVIIVAITHLLVADCAIMVIYLVVSTVDDSVATIAVIVLVFVDVEAKKFVAAFIAEAVIVIITATGGNQNAAPVADMNRVIVLVVDAIGIFGAFGFLAANVADCVFVFVHMVVATELVSTVIAEPVAVLVCADIGHPSITFIAEVIAVFVYVILAKFLHTVSGIIAIVTSAVFIKIIAEVTHPKTAIVTVVIEVVIAVHIVILVTPMEVFQTSIADGVLVFVYVSFARNQVFTHVTEAVAVFVCARNFLVALVAPAVAVFVRAEVVETGIAGFTFVSVFHDDATVDRKSVV